MLNKFFDEIKNKKILITGGTGFIGSHLVEELYKDNEVLVIDNFSSGKKENIKKFRTRIFNLDIAKNDLKDVLKRVDIVFHLAAETSVFNSFNNPISTINSNVLGTVNLLEAMKKSKASKIVFSSSSAVYGDPQYKPIDEAHSINCDSPYAISKFSAEQILRLYALNYGIKSVSLRYFNVFGARQSADDFYGGVIPIFINRVLNRKPLIIYGDGKQTRDFIYIKDVVKANLLAVNFLDKYNRKEPEIFNIGSEKEISINNLAKLIGGRGAITVFRPKRKGECQFSLSRCSKAKTLLNFSSRDPEHYLLNWKQWWET